MNIACFSNGVHLISSAHGSFEVLMSGAEYLDKKILLVCFSAAVKSRHKKSPPFFSGKGLSERTRLSCVSISDETLSLSSQINLSWYGGNYKYKKFQHDIAGFLDTLSEQFRLILVGGSGGGFAAIAIASIMRRQADVFVFNPQTSISKYAEKFVIRYLEVAFPEAFRKFCKERPELSNSALYYEFLDQVGVLHDVNQLPVKRNVRIVYLQNKSDRHLNVHAIPFLQGKLDLDSSAFLRDFEYKENLFFHAGDWGRGHVAPPGELIEKCVNFLASGEDLKKLEIQLKKSEW